ncbi:uncharacterized protein K441DRAFT_316654 [Cenococcum geophilum 1.58]|uniref:uncharacterized protein n=1 Tax=Cenococcum geophilum 1.58 TaxID=794803 RepID=UPI00358FAA07|nr:hypothetical protein K441DRAFT_316654 [Cenococcum geophilum 1.58]
MAPFSLLTTPLSVISSTLTLLFQLLYRPSAAFPRCVSSPVSFTDAVSALLPYVSCINCRSLILENCHCAPSSRPGKARPNYTLTLSQANLRVLLGLSSRDIL